MSHSQSGGCSNCPNRGLLEQINIRLSNIEKEQSIIKNNQLVAKTIISFIAFLGVVAAWFIDHYNVMVDVSKSILGLPNDNDK